MKDETGPLPAPPVPLSMTPSFRTAYPGVASLIRCTTGCPINIHTCRCASIAVTRVRLCIHALVVPTRLIKTTAEKAGRDVASDRLRSTESVVDADAVTATLAAVEAAIHAVNVTARRGVGVACIRHRDLGNALIFAAFLVFGTT